VPDFHADRDLLLMTRISLDAQKVDPGEHVSTRSQAFESALGSGRDPRHRNAVYEQIADRLGAVHGHQPVFRDPGVRGVRQYRALAQRLEIGAVEQGCS
jgi:hypothetical protein